MYRAPPRTAASEAGPIVLLAEDDDELRALMARKLRRAGCSVIEASSGVHLLELIVEHAMAPLTLGKSSASLVISDIRMPGWTGLEVLGLLRRAEVTLPVILITAFGDAATHADARSLGASAVYDKPVDLDELVAAATALVAAR
jgi:CheY-like chemotaxis protein